MIKTDFMLGVYRSNATKINNAIPLTRLNPMKIRRTKFLSVKALSNDKASPLKYQYNFSPKKQFVEDESIQRLQKSLDKQNQTQDPQITDVYQNYEQQATQNTVQNKLCSYFELQAEEFSQKVEKEKVNGQSKLMDTIIKETETKIRKIQNYANNLAAIVQSKYKQTHQFYDQIHHLKNLKRRNRQSREQQGNVFRMQESLPQSHFDQKIKILKQSIAQLLKEIEVIDKDMHKANTELGKIKLERLNFLKMLLKKGYYREDGVRWILGQMLKINYVPSESDMPEFLDAFSRQCLSMEYDNIKIKRNREQLGFKNQEKKLPRVINFGTIKGSEQDQYKKTTPFGNYRSDTEFLPRKNQLRQIYKEAKSFVEEYVRNKNFKDSAMEGKANWHQKMETNYKWTQTEKARMKNVYSPNTRKKVHRLLFGTKLEATYE